MGLPNVRYPDGTEVQPHLDMREKFALYAGIRPVRIMAGAPTPLADPRAARSTVCWCANPPKACSPPAA